MYSKINYFKASRKKKKVMTTNPHTREVMLLDEKTEEPFYLLGFPSIP